MDSILYIGREAVAVSDNDTLVLTQPTSWSKTLVAFEQVGSDLKKEIEQISWTQIVQYPTDFDFDSFIDLLNEIQHATGQNLRNQISALKPKTMSFFNYLDNILSNAQESQSLVTSIFLASFGGYNDTKYAFRILAKELFDIAQVARTKVLDATQLAMSYYFTLWSIVAKETQSREHFKIGLFMMFGSCELAHMVDTETTEPFTKMLGDYCTQIAKDMNFFLTTLKKDYANDLAAHWMNPVFKKTRDGMNLFDLTIQSTRYLAYMLPSQETCRGVFLSNLFTKGIYFYELYGIHFEKMQRIAENNFSLYNTPAEVLTVAKQLNTPNQNLVKAMGDMEALISDLEFIAEKRNETMLSKYLSPLMADIFTRGYANQDDIERYFGLVVGDSNVQRFFKNVGMITENLELNICSSFFKATSSTPMNVGNQETLQKLAEKEKTVANNIRVTKAAIDDQLDREWSESPALFELMIQQFKERILARLEKLDEDEPLFSEKTLKIMAKSVNSVRKDYNMSKSFGKLIVRMILQLHELEQIGEEKIQAIKDLKKEKEEKEIQEEERKESLENAEFYASGVSLLVVSGVTYYLISSNWEEIATTIFAEDSFVKQWSPGVVYQYFSGADWSSFNPIRVLNLLKTAQFSNWFSASGAIMELSKAGLLGLLTYRVATPAFYMSWEALNLLTVPLAKKIFDRHNTSLRHAFLEQRELFSLAFGVEVNLLKETITSALGLRRAEIRRSMVAALSAAAAAASGQYTAAAGLVAANALQTNPNYFTQSLLADSQSRTLQNLDQSMQQQGQIVDQYEQLIDGFTATIQQRMFQRIQQERNLLRITNGIPDEQPEVDVTRIIAQTGRIIIEEADEDILG